MFIFFSAVVLKIRVQNQAEIIIVNETLGMQYKKEPKQWLNQNKDKSKSWPFFTFHYLLFFMQLRCNFNIKTGKRGLFELFLQNI